MADRTHRPGSIRDALANANIWRAQVSFGLTVVAQTSWVALGLILTYDANGALGPGVFVLTRQGLGAITAPAFAALAERWRREHVLAAATAVRAATAAATIAIVAGHLPIGWFYVAGAIEGAAASAPNAIQTALLPWLAQNPPQLVAANALTSISEIGAVAVGGAIDAVLLGVADSEAVLVAVVALFAWGVVLLLRIRDVNTATPSAPRRRFAENFFAGVRYLWRTDDPRLIVMVLTMPGLLIGMLQAFATTISDQLLHLGRSGTPALIVCGGVGGVIGGFACTSLAERRRLSVLVAVGVLLSGAGTLLIGALPVLVLTVVALFGVGAGVAFQNVCGHTLLQRVVPPRSLGLTVGVLGLLEVASVGVGGIAASALARSIGARGALLIVGGAVALAAVGALRGLDAIERRAGSRQREIDTISNLDVFEPLSVGVKAHLIDRAEPVEVADGEAVVRKGDVARDFFVVDDGAFAVLDEDRELRRLGPGDCFGELALLRDSARTATVVADGAGRLWRLDRADFLSAVASNSHALGLAHALADYRLHASSQ